MSNIFKAMRAKKKRAVDPNAPPRPNLMTHDVKIREQKQDFQTLVNIVKQQEEKIRRLESKLNYQTNYLQTLHHKISNSK
jgi:septal ring factor EnvC (AmiA/AmiB activator)